MAVHIPTFSSSSRQITHCGMIAVMVCTLLSGGLLWSSPAQAGSAVLRVQAVVSGSFTVTAATADSVGAVACNGASGSVEYRLYDNGGELISSRYGHPTGKIKSLVTANAATTATTHVNSSAADPVLLAINY